MSKLQTYYTHEEELQEYHVGPEYDDEEIHLVHKKADVDALLKDHKELEGKYNGLEGDLKIYKETNGQWKSKAESAEATIRELQDFAIWMTGAHDFTQYDYFVKHRHLLAKDYSILQQKGEQ